jgi:hypothetical protein
MDVRAMLGRLAAELPSRLEVVNAKEKEASRKGNKKKDQR